MSDPIQGLWIGQALGPMEQCSIRSFLANDGASRILS